MKQLGAVVLSYEEAGDLNGIIPWKTENPAQLHAALREKLIPLSGFIYLSTCNRVEIIYTLEDQDYHDKLLDALIKILPPLGNIRPSHYKGRKALRHMIRLSAGLESMVLGETEIRSQIKDAFENSRLSNLLDKRLRLLIQSIFHEARKIRNAIPMGNLPISVATLASRKVINHPAFIEKADAITDPDSHAIVIIGSGPMSKQAAKYLSGLNNRLILVNRTLSKIEKLSEELNADLATFDRFFYEPETLGPVGAIVTATSREDTFITPEYIEKINVRRKGDGMHPLLLVDMALPPDVDPETAKIPGVELISMETLRIELEQNQQKRLEAAELAEELIEDAGFRIEANLVSGLSGGLIREIQRDIRDKSREKLEHLFEERLSHLSKKDRNLIYTWAIQSHRELNRIHKRGLETVIRQYCENNTHELTG